MVAFVGEPWWCTKMRVSVRIVLKQVVRRCHVGSSNTAPVRVRFAPSPTGEMHIGGLRTALYNYLFAKKYNGQFILRIEDTDQTRLVPGAAERILETLQWAGIPPDEGPTVGGHRGPYVQSERLNIYQEHAHQLLQTGHAYKCICSDMRLQLVRKDALRNRQIPKYDNRCRSLTERTLRDHTGPYVIRLKLSEGDLTFEDGIHGAVTLNIAETEGDPVILKSDGYPTYHLACVVDDHLMGISHVLRGVEWQVSTPKHLMLYQAFGWEPPRFLHLPLMLNKDGTKLSKRQGDIHVDALRDKGYPASAVLNFLILAGGGFGKQTGEEFFDLPKMIEEFRPEELNTNSCQIDLQRLSQCSRLELHSRLASVEGCRAAASQLGAMLRHKYGNRLSEDVLSETYLTRVLQESKERVNSVKDLLDDSLEYIWQAPANTAPDKQGYEDCRAATGELCSRLENLPDDSLDRETIVTLLKQTSRDAQVKHPRFMHFLRHLLSGLNEGPGVGEMMCTLGKERSLERLIKGSANSQAKRCRSERQ